MFNFFLGFSIFFFILSCTVSFYFIHTIDIKNNNEELHSNSQLNFIKLIPYAFIFLNLMYVLPLSIFCLMGLEIRGDISPSLYSFSEYIPCALLLESLFLLIFSFIYKRFSSINLGYCKPTPKFFLPKTIFNFVLAAQICLIFCLIFSLFEVVGGASKFLQKGYSVTTYFIGNGSYVIALDWLISLTIITLAYSYYQKSRFFVWSVFLIILLETLFFLFLSRRGSLIVLLGGAFITYYFSRSKRMSNILIFTYAITGYLLMNIISFTRGLKNLDFGINFFHTFFYNFKKSLFNENMDVFYGLTSGNFSVPFETLPQIIKGIHEGKIYFQFGKTLLDSLTLLIPSFLWHERPLPIANWYFHEFYDSSAPMNIGRQFFFLSDSYLNFGFLGVIIWGLVYGFFLSSFVFIFAKRNNNPLALSVLVLFMANSLNFITTDFIGFIVSFLKSFMFPILLFSCASILVRSNLKKIF